MTRRSLIALPFTCAAASADEVRDSVELNAAIAAAGPGDTITMRDGDWPDADIRFDAAGLPGRPIRLRAATPGGVKLTGASRLRLGGQFLIVEGLHFRDGAYPGEVIAFRTSTTRLASHCRVTDCAIVNYNVADPARDTKWVSLYGFRNRIDRCWFEGKTNLGTTLVVWLPTAGAPNNHWIEHNYFGPRPPLGVNGGETIRVGDSGTSLTSSRTLVENNCFYACNGEVEIISNKSCDNIYRGNTFENCEGTLTLRHGDRALVEGNFFFGNAKRNTGGVRIIGEDHVVVNNYFESLEGTSTRAAISMMDGIPDSPLSGYFRVKRPLVAFNTIVDCAQSIVLGIGGASDQTLAPERAIIANNIVSSSRGPLVRLIDTNADALWFGNLFHGATVGLEGIANADPLLHRDDNGLWTPAAGSPALAAAIGDFPDVFADLLGRARFAPYDAGALQPSTAPATRRRLRRPDVGPSWIP